MSSVAENYIVGIIRFGHLEAVEKKNCGDVSSTNEIGLSNVLINNHFLTHPADTGQLFNPTQVVSPCESGLGKYLSL